MLLSSSQLPNTSPQPQPQSHAYRARGFLELVSQANSSPYDPLMDCEPSSTASASGVPQLQVDVHTTSPPSQVFAGVRPICRPWRSTPLQPLAGSPVTLKRFDSAGLEIKVGGPGLLSIAGVMLSVSVQGAFNMMIMLGISVVMTIIELVQGASPSHKTHCDDGSGGIAGVGGASYAPGPAEQAFAEGDCTGGGGGSSGAVDPTISIGFFASIFGAQLMIALYLRPWLPWLRLSLERSRCALHRHSTDQLPLFTRLLHRIGAVPKRDQLLELGPVLAAKVWHSQVNFVLTQAWI